MEDPVNFAVSSDFTDAVADPELPASEVHNVVFYLRTLKAPIPRDINTNREMAGEEIFREIKCNACHTPALTTATSDIAPLSEVKFYPYTDMLMHDMGSDLDDYYTEGTATTSEWRTPPLWGLGLSKDAQGGQYFLMHDGRATSIEQAILMHGGEGAQSRGAYQLSLIHI